MEPNPLNALADVAANLFISLPDSPQGKPFIDRADANSPAGLLRAVRKRLNLTQREFGILLAPEGGSAISPSVICQLESALQTVPEALVARAVAATTAVQKLGDFLAAQPNSKAADAAGALRALGPGCIDELQPYLDASTDLPPADASTVKEFLSIVTKRRHSTGGSRPGARGPYRKLAKVSEKKPKGGGAAAEGGAAEGGGAVEGGEAPAAATSGHRGTPTGDASAPSSANAFASAAADEMPATPPGGSGTESGRSTPVSTPVSTPGSSRGSSRPRSPTSATGYESDAKSPRVVYRSESTGSLGCASEASSSAFTPGGTVVGLGTPTPNTPNGLLTQHGEASLEVLLALRKLQEENEKLAEENRRLREGSGGGGGGVAQAAPAAPAEMSRADVSMSC